MTQNRLGYNPDGETIDELVVLDATTVHLEQMDDSSFSLIIGGKKQRWHLTIRSRSGQALVDARLQEYMEERSRAGIPDSVKRFEVE